MKEFDKNKDYYEIEFDCDRLYVNELKLVSESEYEIKLASKVNTSRLHISKYQFNKVVNDGELYWIITDNVEVGIKNIIEYLRKLSVQFQKDIEFLNNVSLPINKETVIERK